MSRFALGVVGYSHWNLDTLGAWFAVANGIEHVLKHFSLPENTEVVLVSGLTYYGIPALAYEYAKAKRWKTVGIACNKARTMDCFAVTEKPIYVGDKWGQESETFLDYLFMAYEFEFPCYPRNK